MIARLLRAWRLWRLRAHERWLDAHLRALRAERDIIDRSIGHYLRQRSRLAGQRIALDNSFSTHERSST